MDLFELGNEYLRRSEILTERIHELNRIAKTMTGKEKTLLKRRISSLYSDAAECRKCAQMLISYHWRGNNNETK